MLAELFARVGELEGKLAQEEYMAERLHTVMVEHVVEGLLRGEELVQPEDALWLERAAHAAVQSQLEQGRTTLDEVEMQLPKECATRQAAQAELQRERAAREARGLLAC